MDNRQLKYYNQICSLAVKNNCKVLSDTYINSKTAMMFECSIGHMRIASPATYVRNPLACSKCPTPSFIEAKLKFETLMTELGYIIIGEYKGCHVAVECLCEKNHKCHPIPSNVKKGQGICNKCLNRCPDQAATNFYNTIRENFHGIIIGEYINNSSPIECLCVNTHLCYPIPSSIQQGQGICKKCANRCSEQSAQNFYNTIEQKLKGKVLGEYTKSNKSVACICINNHICFPTPNSIQQGEGMCPKCSSRCPIQAEQIFRELVNNLGGIVIGQYINTDTRIHCQCNKGHDCYPDPDHLKSRGTFCIICTYDEIDSMGEKLTGKVLESLNIKYIKQAKHENLKRLRFDFKFEYNDRTYYIEYDGRQHQQYEEYIHKTIDEFNNSRQRDLMKNYIIKNSTNCILIRLEHLWIKEEKLKNYIVNCLQLDDKLIANQNIYTWLNDLPHVETIKKYII